MKEEITLTDNEATPTKTSTSGFARRTACINMFHGLNSRSISAVNGPEPIYIEKESSSGLGFTGDELVNGGSCLSVFVFSVIRDYVR